METFFLPFFIFVLGLCLGSFFNAWAWRRFENIKVINGRSMCIHCRRQLAWWENIPLFSYIFLHGKCSSCSKLIPIRYFFTELFSGLILVLIFYKHTLSGNFNEVLFFRDLFFSGLLIMIFIYDAVYKIILPSIIWWGSAIGVFLNIYFLDSKIEDLILGAIIAGGFFLLQYLVSNGRWIGGGDVRMGVMMGLWLGAKSTVVALFFAYIVGALFGILMLVFKKKSWVAEIPFGTFLALGTFFAIYHGEAVANWYLNLF